MYSLVLMAWFMCRFDPQPSMSIAKRPLSHLHFACLHSAWHYPQTDIGISLRFFWCFFVGSFCSIVPCSCLGTKITILKQIWVVKACLWERWASFASKIRKSSRPPTARIDQDLSNNICQTTPAKVWRCYPETSAPPWMEKPSADKRIFVRSKPIS